MASKATDQAEESESKVKTLRKEKDELLQAFSIEKQDLMTKLTQLQQIIADKDQELKDIDQEAEDQTAPRANSMARDRGSSEDWETESEVRAAQCETGIEMVELCDRA